MPEPASLAAGLRSWQRLGVLAIGLVLVVHSALLALWLAPSGPVREVVGDDRLATYVDPYFQQGNDLVGIGSNRVDESLELRAAVRPAGGGDVDVTDWVDITAVENRAVRGEAGPARAHQMARRLATNLNFALFGLTPEQREQAAATEADVPVARLQRQLNELGPNSGDVQNFMAQDQMATQFASLWMGAMFDDVELLQVQYRVGRRSVPDLADRTTESVSALDFDYFDVGWRRAFRAEPAARAAFEQYVDGETS